MSGARTSSPSARHPEGTRVDYVAEIKLSGLLGAIQPLLGRAFAGIAKGAVSGMKRELDALAARGAAVAVACHGRATGPATPAKADLPWTCAGSSTTRSRSRVVGSFSRLGYQARRRLYGWHDPQPGALAGRTALVTGPTSGLGRATADSLAALGARVVLVGRSRERLSATAAELAQRHGDAERFPVVVADMSSLASVREAVAAIEASEPRLDILVDSAGAIHAERTVTADGLEATFATMVVGPFVLISGLLPMLERSGDGRVITVVSGGMYGQALPLDDLQFERGEFNGTLAYARAKRAATALTREWGRRLRGRTVRVNAMHPGWADTPGLAESLPGFYGLMGPLLRTPAQGIDTVTWLASHPRGRPRRRSPLPRPAGAALRPAALHAPLGSAATLALGGGRQAGRHPRPGARPHRSARLTDRYPQASSMRSASSARDATTRLACGGATRGMTPHGPRRSQTARMPAAAAGSTSLSMRSPT